MLWKSNHATSLAHPNGTLSQPPEIRRSVADQPNESVSNFENCIFKGKWKKNKFRVCVLWPFVFSRPRSHCSSVERFVSMSTQSTKTKAELNRGWDLAGLGLSLSGQSVWGFSALFNIQEPGVGMRNLTQHRFQTLRIVCLPPCPALQEGVCYGGLRHHGLADSTMFEAEMASMGCGVDEDKCYQQLGGGGSNQLWATEHLHEAYKAWQPTSHQPWDHRRKEWPPLKTALAIPFKNAITELSFETSQIFHKLLLFTYDKVSGHVCVYYISKSTFKAIKIAIPSWNFLQQLYIKQTPMQISSLVYCVFLSISFPFWN